MQFYDFERFYQKSLLARPVQGPCVTAQDGQLGRPMPESAANHALGQDSPRLRRPIEVAAYCRDLALLPAERLLALGLDRDHQVCARVQFMGERHAVAVRPAAILGPCLAAGAKAIVLVHNHPSGSPRPSRADLRYTHRMRMACQIVGVRLLDHVVVAAGGWSSLALAGWPGCGIAPTRPQP